MDSKHPKIADYVIGITYLTGGGCTLLCALPDIVKIALLLFEIE